MQSTSPPRWSLATGYNRDPHLPDLPGLDESVRSYRHVKDYDGGQFAGLDVLVVGLGNAAAKAATELAASGAAGISTAVRTPPHIARRSVWHLRDTGIVWLLVSATVVPVAR